LDPDTTLRLKFIFNSLYLTIKNIAPKWLNIAGTKFGYKQWQQLPLKKLT